MAKLSAQEFIEAIKEMTVLELNDLVKACEEEFGVSAAAGVVVAEALGEAETAGWIGLAPLTLYVQTDKILISMFLWVSYFCVSKRKGEIK